MKNWATLEADQNLILDKHFTPGRAGEKISYIVIHNNGGTFTGKGVYDIWQDRPASAHYQVDVDGLITQLVWDRDTAWHAADQLANRRSIGVEHANGKGVGSPITSPTLDNGAHLVAALCIKYGLGRPVDGKNVFGHNHFSDTDCPGPLRQTQRGPYIARCQSWYDVMTGAVKPAAKPAAPVKSMSGASDEAIDKMARDVINGKYGNGPTRKARLGALYDRVQARVNQLS